MGPVYLALAQEPGITPLVLLTGQHQEQLEQALAIFAIPAQVNLNLMQPGQPLPELYGRMVAAVAQSLRELQPDFVLVHGDTLTTFAAAWASFLEQIPFGHVEAGLRTHDLKAPFPEEANRRLTDALSQLDLAPTSAARDNLLAEGKNPDQIVITGQTGVDAIQFAARVGHLPSELATGPVVSVTLHRRENWPRLAELARALADLARDFPELLFVWPVHKNPLVRQAAHAELREVANFRLLEPLEYGAMAALLRHSLLVITDSGGIQEEGAALGVPVLVARANTERPEGLKTGSLRLAGERGPELYQAAKSLLKQPAQLNQMRQAQNPYGDGKASRRVAQAVAWQLGLAPRPLDWEANEN